MIELNGVLNADTASKLEFTINQILEKGLSPNILIDLKKLSFISSAGIGVFIGSISKIRGLGGDIRFCNAGDEIIEIFSFLEMENFFKFYPSYEEAINAFN